MSKGKSMDEYESTLRRELLPLLSHSISQMIKEQPRDPIASIAKHLRHLSEPERNQTLPEAASVSVVKSSNQLKSPKEIEGDVSRQRSKHGYSSRDCSKITPSPISKAPQRHGYGEEGRCECTLKQGGSRSPAEVARTLSTSCLKQLMDEMYNANSSKGSSYYEMNKELSQLEDEKIALDIAGAHWFNNGSWREVDIEKCWNHFFAKYKGKLKWWHIARNMVATNPPKITPICDRKDWRTIRVFVSSTFKDMFAEREWLVKHVFPEFRQWCAERKLFLAEVDMRWGIPHDTESHKVLGACLNEIKRCQEENEQAYFVGLLGDRYGWVPQEEQLVAEHGVPSEIRREHKWMSGMSVTSLELFVGALWDKNPNAIVLLRDSKWLKDLKDPKILEQYVEDDTTAQYSLRKLKECVKMMLQPEQIYHYNVKLVDTVEQRRATLQGLEDFGNRVLEFLKTRVLHQYPSVSKESISAFERQRAEQESFLEQRSQLILGRDDVIDEIWQYIESDENRFDQSFNKYSCKQSDLGDSGENRLLQRRSKRLSLLNSTISDPDLDPNRVPTLLLTGDSGAGKSSVMAYCAKRAMNDPTLKVVYHFVGVAPGSSSLCQFLTRLWYEVGDLPADEIPLDMDVLTRTLTATLSSSAAKLRAQGKRRLVIFIDAINQIEFLHIVNENYEIPWFPKLLPPDVRLIVSSIDHRYLSPLSTPYPAEIHIKPLFPEVREAVITKYLKVYGKALTLKEIAHLIEKQDSGKPLWLAFACEELRVFGDDYKLTEKIKQMPGTLCGIIEQVIARVLAENIAGGDLVGVALSMVALSRFGLLECELVHLLAQVPLLPEGFKYTPMRKYVHDTRFDRIPAEAWAIVYLTLKQFLMPCGRSENCQCLDFYHPAIKQIVQKLLLTDESVKRFLLLRLADYFQYSCTSTPRMVSQLPHILIQLGEKERLQQVLVDVRVFRQLYQEDSKILYLQYWREAADYQTAGRLYMEAVANSWIKSDKECGVPLEVTAENGVSLAIMLIEMGQYFIAENYLKYLMTLIDQHIGKNTKLTAKIYYGLTHLYKIHANRYCYYNHPESLRLRELAKKTAEMATKLVKQHWDADSPFYLEVHACSCLFLPHIIDELFPVAESKKNYRILVILYWLKGSQLQYVQPIDIPRSYFEKALKLAIQEYGRCAIKVSVVYKIYATMLWNRLARFWETEFTFSRLEECYRYYTSELKILTAIYGAAHPQTIRSREDCLILLRHHLMTHREDLVRLEQEQAAVQSAQDDPTFNQPGICETNDKAMKLAFREVLPAASVDQKQQLASVTPSPSIQSVRPILCTVNKLEQEVLQAAGEGGVREPANCEYSAENLHYCPGCKYPIRPQHKCFED